MPLILPPPIKTALATLHKSGFEAYLVGGCVRDYVLGREIHDYDITTSALPEETKEVFKAYSVHETGIKHGTVLVIIQHCPIEITTYRYEGNYQDHRHPDVVHFTRSLYEDLARRDFTMNALVYFDELKDYYGGMEDISNKLIRAIGDADRRFDEDALRIMRAIRFASQLGFQIEDKTFKAMINQSHLLKVISKERITDEFLKFLNSGFILEAKAYADRIFPILFEEYPHDSTPLYNKLSQTTHPILRLSLWAEAVPFQKELTLPNKTKATIKHLIQYFHTVPKSKYELKCILREEGEELFLLLLEYYQVFYPNEYISIHEMYKDSKDKQEIYSLNQLAIKGHQLRKLGYQGKQIRDSLEYLLDAVMRGKVANTYLNLVEYLEKETMTMKNTVDEYIAAFSFHPLIQKRLQLIRNTAKSILPLNVSETIYHGVPAFFLDGTDILCYGAYQSHITLYVGYDLVEEIRSHYPQYHYSKATVMINHNDAMLKEPLEFICNTITNKL